MRKQIIAVAVLSALSVPAFAEVFPVPESWQVTQRIELKDGNFVNIYKDGKTAMENTFGHAVSMDPGQTMQARDGRTIKMEGNETLRIDLQNPLTSPNYS